MRNGVVPMILLGAVLIAAMLHAAPAQAQATRTWVSGVGDDANPCSRTAPCKTFAGAISKTAAFGEINCLDPGGYGAVTITKSITIACDFTEAGVLTSGTNAITVNVVASDVVTLKGLDIEGLGNSLSGINFIQAGVLHVEKVHIRGYRGGGNGITFAPTGTAALSVDDSSITDNGNSTTTGGIVVRPTGAGSAKVSVNRTQVKNNALGIRVDGTASSGAILGVVRDSMVADNTYNGITALSGAGISLLSVDHASSVGNNYGLVVNGATAYLLVNDSTITVNNTGLFVNSGGGQILSYGNNAVRGNVVADGAFTGFIAPEEQDGAGLRRDRGRCMLSTTCLRFPTGMNLRVALLELIRFVADVRA